MRASKTTDELKIVLKRLITPDWIKRISIRRKLNRYNELITIRNKAYSPAWTLIKDELDSQHNTELDKVEEFDDVAPTNPPKY